LKVLQIGHKRNQKAGPDVMSFLKTIQKVNVVCEFLSRDHITSNLFEPIPIKNQSERVEQGRTVAQRFAIHFEDPFAFLELCEGSSEK
jgi:hypothetical protein